MSVISFQEMIYISFNLIYMGTYISAYRSAYDFCLCYSHLKQITDKTLQTTNMAKRIINDT